MAEDKRNSRKPESGVASWPSGDSGTAKDIITTISGGILSIHDYIITYDDAGSATATIELYDDEAGTAEADLGDPMEIIQLHPGDSPFLATDLARDDIEDTLIGVVRNNNDNVDVSVGGFIITG